MDASFALIVVIFIGFIGLASAALTFGVDSRPSDPRAVVDAPLGGTIE